MTDRIISPDGKFMWTGSEWIPAPPSGKLVSQNHDITNTEIVGQLSQSSEGGDNNNQKINLQDVNAHKGVKQTAISEGSSSQELKVSDTVIMGDLTQNTTINSIEDTKIALKEMFDQAIGNLRKMGFDGDSSPAELTPSQEVEVEQVLEMSEQLTSHGIEIDPWTEMWLGISASMRWLDDDITETESMHTAQQHYLRALEIFRINGDRKGEAASLNRLGNIAQARGDLAEAERLQRECLPIMREIGDREGEGRLLSALGNIAQARGDLAEAERLQRECLAIMREVGDQSGEAESLKNLGNIAKERGDQEEAYRCYNECICIQQEIGEPIHPDCIPTFCEDDFL